MSRPYRPRVVIVVTAAVTARLFRRGFAEYLSAMGYDVMLVADDVSELKDGLAARGIATHSLPMRRDPAPLRDLVSFARVIRFIARARPDAVIYATPKASLLTSLAARLTKVPVRVYELWGIRFETATGIARGAFRVLERIISTCSTSIIANSRSLALRAEELGVAAHGRILSLGAGSSHGVDVEHFSPLAPIPPIDVHTAQFLDRNVGATIGFVGRLHPDKGVDVLLGAAERMQAAGTPVRVLLVGGYEGVNLPKVESVPVHCVGEVDDVRPFIAEFDVLVLMSLREGFPNVVLEAAAMEVPAIVSDATGCVDSVVPGETGIIVRTGDVDGLATALISLVSDPDRIKSMGEGARKRVEEKFSPSRVWGTLEEHLRGQLKEAGKVT